MVAAGSAALHWMFSTLAVVLAMLFVAGVYVSDMRVGSGQRMALRRAAVSAAAAATWLALTGALAAKGLLHFEPPPTMVPVFVVTLAIAFCIAFSPLGHRLAVGLPIAALVLYQAFRIAVELLLHRAYNEGLMPVQMSYSGRNFDVVSGVTALVLGAVLVPRGDDWDRRLVFAWNTLGLGLLANIVGVALLSAPTPFRVFMNEPANTWITHAPWIWLPTVMVLAALTGHLLVYRRLWIESRKPPSTRSK